MSGYQLFFVHSVRIHCGLKKLPVMILSDVSSEPHLLSSMPPVSHLSIVIDFVQQQLCLRPDTETAYVIASKDCPLSVVLTTYGRSETRILHKVSYGLFLSSQFNPPSYSTII